MPVLGALSLVRMMCCAAAYVLVLNGSSHHNGDERVELSVADSRAIFFTQSIYRCQPKVHVVCEVRRVGVWPATTPLLSAWVAELAPIVIGWYT